LDRALSYVIITPLTHKFHHHFERPWTDTNFGNVLSIWDRLFGTFVYGDPDKIKYGVDVVDNSRDSDVKYQLGFPLNKNIKTDY
ncbi:MAG: sterol desaturase family protein, partial [Bacteroidota bacterium]